MKLSEKLKELRAEKGKTQKEVATVLGISKKLYEDWELGKIPIYRYLCQLEAYYETPLVNFVGTTENKMETAEPIIESPKAEKIKVIKEKRLIIKKFLNQLDKLLKDLENFEGEEN